MQQNTAHEAWDPETVLAGVQQPAPTRAEDPVSSLKAAGSVKVTPQQKIVLEVLYLTGRAMCDEEIHNYMLTHTGFKASESGLRTRRANLVDAGLVTQAGTGSTKSGRLTILWNLTPRGREIARGLRAKDIRTAIRETIS